jgi:hypothetical protein
MSFLPPVMKITLPSRDGMSVAGLKSACASMPFVLAAGLEEAGIFSNDCLNRSYSVGISVYKMREENTDLVGDTSFQRHENPSFIRSYLHLSDGRTMPPIHLLLNAPSIDYTP